MNIPRYKRHMWKHKGDSDPKIGVISENQIDLDVNRALTIDDLKKLDGKTIEQSFEYTFRYASEFICWIDTEWQSHITAELTPIKYKFFSKEKSFLYYIEQLNDGWFITIPCVIGLDFHYSTFVDFKDGFDSPENALVELKKYIRA